MLLKHYDEQFKLRGSRFIFEDNQTKEENKINEDYGWQIKIPWGWEVLRNDNQNNFFWMGSEYPYRWISVRWDKGNYIDDELSIGERVWNFPLYNYKSIRFNDHKFKLDMLIVYPNLICSTNFGTIEPLLPKTFPYLTHENFVL